MRLHSLPTVKEIFGALTEQFELRVRDSQIKLAERVRNTLAGGGVCCIEAPTGTGKTLGYLAGALDAQAHAGRPVPIVVATATVSLQEQVIRYDIPRLVAVGAVEPGQVAIAKGRGRYFCPRTASALESKTMQDSQTDMFDADKVVAEPGVPVALDMLKAWKEKRWDGDQDSWEGEIPACWDAACAAKSDTCVNRACEHFAACPYMASRAKLATAKVIVANHDMVLADLAQRAEEQTITALPPKQYMLIFDEAHNLPEKAVGTQKAEARLSDTDWLRKLSEYSERALSYPQVVKALERGVDFDATVFSVGASLLTTELTQLADHVNMSFKFSASGLYSWSLGDPPSATLELVQSLAVRARAIHEACKAVSKVFSDIAEESIGVAKGHAIRMLADTHQISRKVSDIAKCMSLFCSGERLVRWVSRDQDGKITMHTQPMEGRDVLERLLWNKEIPVALVSATLQVAGSFERFAEKTGLPASALTEALPPVFDYSRGFLHKPVMDSSPGEPGYEAELVDKLTRLYNANTAQGMLVLFTSRQTMRRVIDKLPADLKEVILSPDKMPVAELVALHKDRIDANERSVLVGLDSMAEGLDLPGHYCGHVIITRLPFAVPGDPVEEARRETLGTAWFEQAYLADMLITLIQACGRLIRREDDHGIITILDKRLTVKKYKSIADKALPGFSRGTKLVEYHALAKEKGFIKPQPKAKAAVMP